MRATRHRPGLEADRRQPHRGRHRGRDRAAPRARRTEVLRIERLRLADGEPIAIEVLFLGAERFDGITASLGDDVSFYQLLHSDYGVEFDSAEETIEAVVAGAREAKLLGCPPGSALLQLSRLTTDTAHSPIEYVHSLYRGDRFRFRQRLERQLAGRRSGPVLRQATAVDAAGLAEVFVAAWQDAYQGVVDAEILESLDTRRRGVALRGHGLTGHHRGGRGARRLDRWGSSASARIRSAPKTGTSIRCTSIPSAGGRGTGRRLLEHASRGARAAGHADSDAVGLRGKRAGAPLLRRRRLRPRRRPSGRARVAGQRDPPGPRHAGREEAGAGECRRPPSRARLRTGRRRCSGARANVSLGFSANRSPAVTPPVPRCSSSMPRGSFCVHTAAGPASSTSGSRRVATRSTTSRR